MPVCNKMKILRVSCTIKCTISICQTNTNEKKKKKSNYSPFEYCLWVMLTDALSANYYFYFFNTR